MQTRVTYSMAAKSGGTSKTTGYGIRDCLQGESKNSNLH